MNIGGTCTNTMDIQTLNTLDTLGALKNKGYKTVKGIDKNRSNNNLH